MIRNKSGWFVGLLCTGIMSLSVVGYGATINIVATDSDEENLAKIEAAGPGDEVVVGPGTYKFRLYLENSGTSDQPIVIRALDPEDRPVWDLDGKSIGEWPGSYDGGDKSRAIWQITGSYMEISGIVFQNGTDGVGDGAGLRFKFAEHVTLRDCLFQFNDNGIQGAATDALVEFCEFNRNGLPDSAEGSHNLYIHGGTITVRYSYIHDPLRAQNIHIRANSSVFEYNWIARASSYMGDMMPCTMEPCEKEHTMLLRGNVFLRGTPANDGQVFVMYNDQHDPDVSFSLTMTNNTVIGNGDGAALVHFGNADESINAMQTALINNNVIYNVARIFRVDEIGLDNWSASGFNNWFSDGTVDVDGLENNVSGADPGFTDLGGRNFVPAGGSPLIGAASGLEELPDREYYRDENSPMFWRWRTSVNDIGAFESTTQGDTFGPYTDGDVDSDTDTDTDADTDTDVEEDGGLVADAGADAGAAVDAGLIQRVINAEACSCRTPGSGNQNRLLEGLLGLTCLF